MYEELFSYFWYIQNQSSTDKKSLNLYSIVKGKRTDEEIRSCFEFNWMITMNQLSETRVARYGNIKWFWSFIKGNEGFIFSSLASISDKEQVDLKGVIFF